MRHKIHAATRHAALFGVFLPTVLTATAASPRCSATNIGNCYPMARRACCDPRAVCYTKYSSGELQWAQCRIDQCSAVCGWECRALSANSTTPTFGRGAQSKAEALAAMVRPLETSRLRPQGNSERLGNVVDAWYFPSHPAFGKSREHLLSLTCKTCVARHAEGDTRKEPCLARYLASQFGRVTPLGERRTRLVAEMVNPSKAAPQLSWDIYSYAVVAKVMPEFRTDLQRVLRDYSAQFDAQLASQSFEGGPAHLVIHYRLGDFIGLGQCIDVKSVAAAAAALQPSPVVIEVLEGGVGAFWLGTQPPAAQQSPEKVRRFSKSDSVSWSRRLRQMLLDELGRALPEARIVPPTGRSVDEDFYRMVHAPLLVTAGGSFAVAAAAAAYGAQVRTPAASDLNHPHLGKRPEEQLADNWRTYSFQMLSTAHFLGPGGASEANPPPPRPPPPPPPPHTARGSQHFTAAKVCRKRSVTCEPQLQLQLQERCGVQRQCRYVRWPTLHFEQGFEVLLAGVVRTGDATRLFTEALTRGSSMPIKPAWRGKHLRIRGPLCDGFWVRALLVIVIGTWAALNGLPFHVTADATTDSYYSPQHGLSGWEHYFEPIGGIPLATVRATVPENATLELDCDAVWQGFREIDSSRGLVCNARGLCTGSVANGTIYPITTAHARSLRLLRAEQVKHFVRVRAEVQAKADVEWQRITQAAPHRSVLGVHMRGTDAHVSKPAVQSDFFAMIDAYVAAHGGPESVLIFLATDDERFVSSARKRLGAARVQMQAAGAVVRGSADRPAWKDNDGTQNLRRGTEVVLDTLLLSRCDFLLKSGSAVSEFAIYFAPRLIDASFDFNIADQQRPEWARGVTLSRVDS